MAEETGTDTNEPISGMYNLIPVVTTPKVNPGGKLVVDYYVTGSHPEDSPPEYVRLNVNIHGLTPESGTVTQYVDQQWKNDGTSLQFIRGEEVATHQLPEKQKTFSLKIPEALFFPIPDQSTEDNPDRNPPLFGELETNDNGDPPYRMELEIPNSQNSGDHKITSTLVYEQDGRTEVDRVTNDVHVNTWYERNQRVINTIIIILTLFGVLFPVIEFLILS